MRKEKRLMLQLADGALHIPPELYSPLARPPPHAMAHFRRRLGQKEALRT